MKSVSAEAGFARNVSMHALLKHESATDLYESLSEASYSNRPTTPASPEVEEFLLEESELDLSPLSKFENLPTEVSRPKVQLFRVLTIETDDSEDSCWAFD